MRLIMDKDEPKVPIPYNHSSPHFDVDIIDQQHDELTSMLNQISSLVFNKTEDIVVVKLLAQLIEKSAIHFAMEEELVRWHCPPNEIASHVQCHLDALATLVALKNKLELDMIKYQVKYTSDMTTFVERAFRHDTLLMHRMKGKITTLNTPNNPARKSTVIEIP